MGRLGQYVMVSEDTLEQMMEMEGEGLMDTLEELIEAGNPSYEIDKLWDGLHFLLTGVSASVPIEGNRLSESVVCVHVFDVGEDDGFFTCTEQDELAGIIQAMKQVDFDELESGFDLASFRSNNIYPRIWEENRKEALWHELKGEFSALLAFYEKALAAKQHVIFSVV
ncbi:YfbM family protein [Cohnella mopanensis]|uniref:YfbM family protein n=1 Tax=Cohnella mopanensis TaxID=2911966 RepID=UPI001EF7D212|nr:YfbM family protein [Cohnella mopanensis]